MQSHVIWRHAGRYFGGFCTAIRHWDLERAARTGTSTKTAPEFLTIRFPFSCLYNSCVSFWFCLKVCIEIIQSYSNIHVHYIQPPPPPLQNSRIELFTFCFQRRRRKSGQVVAFLRAVILFFVGGFARMLPQQILKIRVSKMAIFRILLRPISCSSSLLLFSSFPPSLPCSFFSCTNCCRDIFPTTQTVQGQLSPWFLVEAWLPFRNREMDYFSHYSNCARATFTLVSCRSLATFQEPWNGLSNRKKNLKNQKLHILGPGSQDSVTWHEVTPTIILADFSTANLWPKSVEADATVLQALKNAKTEEKWWSFLN